MPRPFFNNLSCHGANLALIAPEGHLSYADLMQQSDAFGACLAPQGLLCLLATNRTAAIVGYLGAMRAKVPILLLNADMHADLLSHLLAVYQPQHIWGPTEKLLNLVELQHRQPTMAAGDYTLLPTGWESAPIHDNLALLVTTSGSTGSPKLVRQSYANLASNAAAIAQYLELTPESRPITSLPMHYVFGLSVINSHLHVGAPIILTEAGIMERAFWATLSEHRATTFSGIPYTFEMLRRLHFERMDVPTLSVITQAGGKLDAKNVRMFGEICAKKNIRFFVMYGAAEATSRMGYLPSDTTLDKPSSIGIPIPNGKFWLEDEDGREIQESNQVGELVFSGPNVALGYATCREDLAREDDKAGVHQTGDLAWRDDDGYYYIAGRKRGFIKIFGNRVNMEDMEQHVRSHGCECACDGEDDCLRIYITDPQKEQWVKEFISNLTGLHISAFHPVIIEKIPRNAAGKILYAALPKPEKP